MSDAEEIIRAHNEAVWNSEAGPELRVWHCLTCGNEVYGDHIHDASAVEMVDGRLTQLPAKPCHVNIVPWLPGADHPEPAQGSSD